MADSTVTARMPVARQVPVASDSLHSCSHSKLSCLEVLANRYLCLLAKPLKERELVAHALPHSRNRSMWPTATLS